MIVRNLLVISAASVLLTGCVSMSKPMKNANGQIVECKTAGWGWLGAPVALASQANCVDRLKKQGYVALDKDPNDISLPSSAIRYDSGVVLPLPDGWATQPLTSDLKARGIKIYALNHTIDAGVMVSTVKRSAITDLQKYLQTRRAAAASSGVGGQISDTVTERVNDRDAYHYEVTTSVNGSWHQYAYTLLVGEKEIAIVTAWTLLANYELTKPTLAALPTLIGGI